MWIVLVTQRNSCYDSLVCGQISFVEEDKWHERVKDYFQLVLRSLNTLIFINIISLTQWNANQCYSLQTTYLIWDLSNSFSNSFIDFNSCEVVSSSDMRKNEAESFASIIAVDMTLWIYFM